MIPDWFAAVDHAWRLLRPGGTIGVVDFYVGRKHPEVRLGAPPLVHAAPSGRSGSVPTMSSSARTTPRTCTGALRPSISPNIAPGCAGCRCRTTASSAANRGRAMRRVLHYRRPGRGGPGAGPAVPRRRLARRHGREPGLAPVALVAGRRPQLRRSVAQPEPDGYVAALLRIIRREAHRPPGPDVRRDFLCLQRARKALPCIARSSRRTSTRCDGCIANGCSCRPPSPTACRVPSTQLLTSPEDARQALASGRELVFKPVYSRFAAHTIVRPRGPADLPADVSERRPWVAQEYVPGRQICTYGVAHAGRLTVHCAYLAEFTFGIGAAIAHAALDHAASRAWVEAFVRGGRLHGPDRLRLHRNAGRAALRHRMQPAGHERRPPVRGRSGIPAGVPGRAARPAPAGPGPASMYALLMAARLPHSLGSWAGLRRWGAAFFGGRDVFFRADDPAPFLAQLATFATLAAARPPVRREPRRSIHARHRMERRPLNGAVLPFRVCDGADYDLRCH